MKATRVRRGPGYEANILQGAVIGGKIHLSFGVKLSQSFLSLP